MKQILLSLSLALTLAAGSALAQAQKVNAVRIGNRIDVTIGGQFFTSYRFEEDEKYPFFFPVNGPKSGGSVTSMRNGTYPHHSSLFFGCDRVNGGNYWQEGLERGRIVSVGARVVQTGGEKPSSWTSASGSVRMRMLRSRTSAPSRCRRPFRGCMSLISTSKWRC